MITLRGTPTARTIGWAVALAAAATLLLPAHARSQARQYDIDASASSLQVRLFGAGLLSAFAHDHLLVADGMAGRIVYNPADLSQSAVQLSVPVASLIVDDPQMRAEAGIEGELAEDDVAEVRETMLSDEFLDAETYSRVIVTVVEVTGGPPVVNAALNVRIKDQEQVLHVPTRISAEGDRFHAEGELFLKQTDFGIEPFSSFMGSLAVEDAVQVRFNIVGVAQ